MRAAIRRKYGPPEILKIENIEKPIPKDDEVLVKVHATTVNRTDVAVMTGKPFIMRFFVGLLKPKSPIPGVDFAGQIEAIGKGVTSFNVGDKVWGFKDEGLNSQAEYITYPASANIDLLPKSVSYEEGVACLEGAHYAYNFMKKAELKVGDKVLLNGATGAIGSAALQMLKNKNIEVTATCNTKNIELIKSLGADRIINWEKEDFTKENNAYDYILDAVGKSSFTKCKPQMKDGAIYLSSELGDYGANIFYALKALLFGGNKRVIFPIPSDIKSSMAFMKKLLEEGKFKPVIDRKYPLEEIAEAYKYVASGQKTGNVVISMVS